MEKYKTASIQKGQNQPRDHVIIRECADSTPPLLSLICLQNSEHINLFLWWGHDCPHQEEI